MADIEFTTNIELCIVETADDDGTFELYQRGHEAYNVSILDETDEHYDLQFEDGSVSVGVPKNAIKVFGHQ